MSINSEILKRFFDGKYSRKDFITIRNAFGGKMNDPELKKQITQHWEEYNQEELPAGQIDHLLHKIHHQISLDDNKVQKQFTLWNAFQRIAAILILPLSLAFFAYLFLQQPDKEVTKSYAEIQCPLGVRTKFTLPDGSTGFLNSGSTLKYPVNFDQRKVELTGEAYFEVIHNKDLPFYVNTQNLDIKVLGTTFNVIAHKDESTEEVILQSGKVGIFAKSGKKLATLSPDQQLLLNTVEKKFTTSQVLASQYTSWTEGKLVFRNESMVQVAKRIGRWYNADIIINDKRLEDYTYHATFIDEQLDQVLKLIALTTPISYSIIEQGSNKDNIYNKRKIILTINTERIKEFK